MDSFIGSGTRRIGSQMPANLYRCEIRETEVKQEYRL